ncbi:hypothetical protein A2773_02070 [Candidatus Gottesmanbacteria bacterium RIFCSPHIGHO2_01_FULL_39_10]|uniref:Glycosyl hydrolases family 39 N-terminal catalytic domain-containing protein n=1 Tax=Candidatus Gottesmanbacteria bacterium RIFCSPHIGHO2_01_FULL_39_10 TaxID=1798375 RepID=A0A1F5ZR92_9BACT|nr:MAG: hypothetical protein A2773_02070 [Candidatus Gottesmanbacteria bacterium RIFCSPHIGHO2_01_FULL_39_10]
MPKRLVWIVYLFIAILTLPLLVLFVQKAQQYISRAGGTRASIIVDAQSNLGILPRPWEALAQGGEEPPPMLQNLVGDIKNLSPRYIRIDHIYDHYSVVEKIDGKLIYNFSKLDETVSDIIASGALPFFSLSYMPPPISQDGQVTSAPQDWRDWESIVEETVKHYSGKANKNLSGIYYEVWNEPDLFGRWGTSGDPDYRLLYHHSVTGAGKATNTNSFFMGGPSLTSYQPTYMKNFLEYVSDNNLRLDFLTWHRYSYYPDDYSNDAQKARETLSGFSKYEGIPFFITEWGIDSENNPFFDTKVSAAHTVASLRQMLGNINLGFIFEIKDGPPPGDSPFWGRWGLITHENAGLSKKPRYEAVKLLSELRGNRVRVNGEGSWITGFGSKTGETIKLILSNYDYEGLNSENVPVTFSNLDPGSYIIDMKYTNGNTKKNEYVVTEGLISQNVIMNPNDVILLTLSKNASIGIFTQGRSEESGDSAILVSDAEFSLPLNAPLSSEGTISFDIKPDWDGRDSTERIILDIPIKTGTIPVKHITLKKSKIGFSNKLVFGIFDENTSKIVSAAVDNWLKGEWQNVTLKYTPTELTVLINGTPVEDLANNITVRGGDEIIIYPFKGALDNLVIESGNKEILKRTFDGSIDE